MIKADAALKAVFGGKATVNMFEMTKLVEQAPEVGRRHARCGVPPQAPRCCLACRRPSRRDLARWRSSAARPGRPVVPVDVPIPGSSRVPRTRRRAARRRPSLPAVTIEPMTFGPARPDLMPGAQNAVDTCLAIQPGERVALVADEPSREVAASLEQALRDARRARSTAVLIEAVAARPIRVAPPRVLEALERRRRRHPLRAADGRGARRAHGDRRRPSSGAGSATRT